MKSYSFSTVLLAGLVLASTGFSGTITGLVRYFGAEPGTPNFNLQMNNGTTSFSLTESYTQYFLPLERLLLQPVSGPGPLTPAGGAIDNTFVFTFAGSGFLSVNGASLTTLQANDYTLLVQLTFAPYTSGAFVNNSTSSGDVDFTVANGISPVAGVIRLRDGSGTCVFCESLTGSSTLNGLFSTRGGGGRNLTIAFDAEPVPEPSTAALAGIALASGAILLRRRRQRS